MPLSIELSNKWKHSTSVCMCGCACVPVCVHVCACVCVPVYVLCVLRVYLVRVIYMCGSSTLEKGLLHTFSLGLEALHACQ